MRNAWRITRWDPGAGTPTYLLASAFTVTPSLCAQATRVDCVIDSSNSIRGTTNFRHFAHAAESLLACWSFFRRYPAARPRLVLKDLRSIDGVIWAESLVRLMGCEVLGGIRAWQYYLPMATLNAAGCAVRGALRQRSGNGYKGREAPRRPKHIRTQDAPLSLPSPIFPSPPRLRRPTERKPAAAQMKWLMSESDASELQQRLHRYHTAGGVLRVGIANRREVLQRGARAACTAPYPSPVPPVPVGAALATSQTSTRSPPPSPRPSDQSRQAPGAAATGCNILCAST